MSSQSTKGKRSTAFGGLGRIDVHHHCFPKSVPALASEFEHNSFTSNYDPFPSKPEDHLKYMDSTGIQTAVIVRHLMCLQNR